MPYNVGNVCVKRFYTHSSMNFTTNNSFPPPTRYLIYKIAATLLIYITFWHFPSERELTRVSAMLLVSATCAMNSRHLTWEIHDHRRKSWTQIQIMLIGFEQKILIFVMHKHVTCPSNMHMKSMLYLKHKFLGKWSWAIPVCQAQ